MNKTIKQIADEIGVTPQAIYQRKKQEPLSTDLIKHIEKKGNTVYIDEMGQALILQAFQSEALKKTNQPLEKQDTVVERLLTALENELSEKNQSIEAQQEIILAQQETIKELSTALQTMTDNLSKSQALHAGTTKALLDSMEDTEESEELNDPIKKEADTTQASPQTSKGFWGRLFKK